MTLHTVCAEGEAVAEGDSTEAQNHTVLLERMTCLFSFTLGPYCVCSLSPCDWLSAPWTRVPPPAT